MSTWLTLSALEYWAKTCKPGAPKAAKLERLSRETTVRDAQKPPASPVPSSLSLPSPGSSPVRGTSDQSSLQPLRIQCDQVEKRILSILDYVLYEFLVFQIHEHNKCLLDIRRTLYNLFCSDSNQNSNSPGTKDYMLQLRRVRLPSLLCWPGTTVTSSVFYWPMQSQHSRGDNTHLLGTRK